MIVAAIVLKDSGGRANIPGGRTEVAAWAPRGAAAIDAGINRGRRESIIRAPRSQPATMRVDEKRRPGARRAMRGRAQAARRKKTCHKSHQHPAPI
jgi:hypothetical protein